MRNLKLMIVDDHAAFRQVVKSLVQPLIAELVECEDGQEAVDRYPHVQPDMVLMDIAMKPLDGLQASARIKGCFPDAQIIILTQYNDAGLHAAATKSGACGYVLKENLLQVRELIEAESRREPARHR